MSKIVVPSTMDDLAMIKVEQDIDTSIHTPVCLPERGFANFNENNF